MTEDEALKRMIAPGTIRPGKMGNGGVVQIHITRACTLSCYNCTQGSNLRGKTSFISIENFEKAVLSLRGYFGLRAMFGGQPTLHPQFPGLCAILSKHVPIEKRGLWTNALNGHGEICRRTFRPENCNLNVHLDQKAAEEFRRTWPEANIVGLTQDSRHSPPFVALKDVVANENTRWDLISSCPINRHWSSLIGEFRGKLRAWFCELAGAQSMLHQDEADYPDTGLDLEDLYAFDTIEQEYLVFKSRVEYDAVNRRYKTLLPEIYPDQTLRLIEWWQLPMFAFRDQVRKHCHECGVPLQGFGELSQAADDQGVEQVSATHENVYKPKRKGRRVELVTLREQLGTPLKQMTKYLENGRL